MTELEWLLLALSLAAVALPLTWAWCSDEDRAEPVCEPDLRLLAALARARQPAFDASPR